MSGSSLLASLGAALHSFPSSSRLSSRSGSTKTDPALCEFEEELASQLEGLRGEDAEYMSIAWLCRAIETVLWTHSTVEGFVPDLQQALANGDSKWLDDYLDDNIKLLDICRALREAIADMKLYHTHLQRVIHTLQHGELRKPQLYIAMKAVQGAMGALKRKEDDVNYMSSRRSKLDNCSSMLRRMGEKANMEDMSKGNVFMVIYAAQVTTIFICGVLTSALSFKPRRAFCTVSVSGHSTWALFLNSLQQRVKEKAEKKRSRGANAQLEELDKSEIIIRNLNKTVELCINAYGGDTDASLAMEPQKHNQFRIEIQQELVTLISCEQELFHGLTQLDLRVNEIFKVLIHSRVALLDIYSHAA